MVRITLHGCGFCDRCRNQFVFYNQCRSNRFKPWHERYYLTYGWGGLKIDWRFVGSLNVFWIANLILLEFGKFGKHVQCVLFLLCLCVYIYRFLFSESCFSCVWLCMPSKKTITIIWSLEDRKGRIQVVPNCIVVQQEPEEGTPKMPKACWNQPQSTYLWKPR